MGQIRKKSGEVSEEEDASREGMKRRDQVTLEFPSATAWMPTLMIKLMMTTEQLVLLR